MSKEENKEVKEEVVEEKDKNGKKVPLLKNILLCRLELLAVSTLRSR